MAEGIVPHRALYSVSLAGQATNVDDARGLLSIELERGCERWNYSQRFELQLIQAGLEPTGVSVRITAWESFDGKRYGFRSVTDYGSNQSVTMVGQATASAHSESKAIYTEPVAFERTLPPGSAFPVAWLKKALNASLAKSGRVAGHVFFGASPEEPLRVNTVILPAKAVDDAGDLLKGRRWRHISAFYNAKSGEEPEYEANETLVENGILAGALMRYPTYDLKVALQRVEALPPADC